MILDERSLAGPALTDGYLAWAGRDTRINVLATTDGVTWGEKRTLDLRPDSPDRTDSIGYGIGLAPAVASTTAGLVVAWTGWDGRLSLLGPAGWTTLDESSRRAPALAAAGDDILLAWAGTDGRLNVARGDPKTLAFGPTVILSETSRSGPAVAASDEADVALAWSTHYGRLHLLVGDGQVFRERRRLDDRSQPAPALAWTSDGCAMAWTGTDWRVNVLAGRRHQVLAARSRQAPALSMMAGRLTVGWTGRGGQIHVEAVVD